LKRIAEVDRIRLTRLGDRPFDSQKFLAAGKHTTGSE
jgi:hypothetical protein